MNPRWMELLEAGQQGGFGIDQMFEASPVSNMSPQSWLSALLVEVHSLVEVDTRDEVERPASSCSRLYPASATSFDEAMMEALIVCSRELSSR